ncbi:class I SAM-dependent methyltransferase [Deinococcus radiodurans]|nr:class I SAM-dependent methyltransferase [Deinococcus radiodurans]
MSTAPKPTVQNPFASADAAGRYAAGRPAFHLLVLSRLAPHLTGRELGADVACGTGLSSAALAELVGEVRAFDASAAMLAEAAPHPRVTYAQAPAEALPLADGVLDVMTVAQAFHWFDHAAFLAEARRTLKPGGVLALYDDFFLGEMEGSLTSVPSPKPTLPATLPRRATATRSARPRRRPPGSLSTRKPGNIPSRSRSRNSSPTC